MKQYSNGRNNETVIPNKIIVEDCRRPDRADDNFRHNNFIFSSLLSICLKWILLYETIFLWNNKLLAAYDMLLMSYAYYYFYYEKSPNDKPKGAHHTPERGVVGTLRLVAWSPMLLSFWWWLMCEARRKRRRKVEEFKDEIHRTQKNVNWKSNEYIKQSPTSPTAQKILKLGGSNKGIWKSMQQKFQTLMMYISPKF